MKGAATSSPTVSLLRIPFDRTPESSGDSAEDDTHSSRTYGCRRLTTEYLLRGCADEILLVPHDRLTFVQSDIILSVKTC